MRKLLVFLALVLLSVCAAGPALAQDETPWTCTYDFTLSDWGFDILPVEGAVGEYTESVGFEDTFFDFEPTGNQYRGLRIFLEFPETTLLSVDSTFEYTAGVFDADSGDSSYYLAGSEGPLEFITLPSVPTSPENWTGTATTSSVDFALLTGVKEDDTGDPGGSTTLAELELTGEGPSPCAELEFTKPLRAEDVDGEWNSIETYAAGVLNTQKTMFMYSDASGAKVHSPTPGTVTNIHKVQLGDCYSYLFAPGTIALAQVGICAMSVHGYVFFLPGSLANTPVQVVTIEGDNGYRFIYFVKNADDYITEGQHVEANCWIGETFHLETVVLSASLGPFGVGADSTPGSGGAVIFSLQHDAVPVDGPDFFTVEANGTAPCNQPEGYADCMGDAPLNIPSQWTVNKATWNEPGITLQPGGSISQTMNLLETLNPQMKVMAQSIGGSGTFTMQLGTTVQMETATPTATEFQIEPDAHEADLGGLYTVKVKNTSTVSIDLTYICVQNTTDEGGDPVDPPPEGPPDTPNGNQNPCTFTNNSFADSTTNWTVSPGVDIGPGEIRVPDTGTWSQNVSVPDGTYTLTVVASIWSYNAFTPDDTDTTDVTIEWDFPADTTYDGSESHTFGEFAESGLVVFQMEVVITPDTTGDFTMRLSLDSVPSDVRGIAIRSVCLGDGSKGGGGGGGTPGEDGPFEVSCTASSHPSGDGFGSWISWLWGKFRGFFSCELMVLLNKMYTLMQDSYRLFGWSIRYSQAVSVQSMDWVSAQALPWLAGHLSNIAIGQVTTISSADDCGNLFCLLKGVFESSAGVFNGILDILNQLVDPNSPFWDVVSDFFNDLFDVLSVLADGILSILNRILDFLISVLGQVIGLLGTILIGIVGIIVSLIAKAFELFDLIRQIITLIISSWLNAVPVEWSVLPSCAMDQTSPRCMFFYIMERTIFTESGQYFIPVVVAGLWLNIFIWVMNRVKRGLVELGVLS